MEVLHPRCTGLDMYKDSAVACVRRVSPPEAHEVRAFTTPTGLLILAGWLKTHGCTPVAMETTGTNTQPALRRPATPSGQGARAGAHLRPARAGVGCPQHAAPSRSTQGSLRRAERPRRRSPGWLA